MMLQWTWRSIHLFELVFLFSLDKIPQSGIAGSYGNSIFNCLRKIHDVFHSDCTNLLSCQQYTSVPFFPYPHLHLLFLVLMIAIVNSHYHQQVWSDMSLWMTVSLNPAFFSLCGTSFLSYIFLLFCLHCFLPLAHKYLTPTPCPTITSPVSSLQSPTSEGEPPISSLYFPPFTL